MKNTKAELSSRRAFLKSSGQIVTASALLGALSPRAYASEDSVIRVALVGCGGRGSGAAANAMAVKNGPVKLFAMADVFEERLQHSYNGLIEAASAPRTEGSADIWVMGYRADQIDVPPERRFVGLDAYRKAIDCLRPGDVVILTTPVAFRWVHFRYAIQKGINVFMEKPVTVDGPSTRKMLE
ncbi:MAG: gfo/Idh/MocA family oxidoreductase, partial [Planctomycetes bacterium]|nr:gfo/Idh/MocA family oxidoreductase [Planctomycetota bacterium]